MAALARSFEWVRARRWTFGSSCCDAIREVDDRVSRWRGRRALRRGRHQATEGNQVILRRMGTTYMLMRRGEEKLGTRADILTRLGSLGDVLAIDGDPVHAISVEHGAPWDLLPAVDALNGLAGLAIFDPQSGRWIEPDSVRPRPSTPIEPWVKSVRDPGARWSVGTKDSYGLHGEVVVAGECVLALGSEKLIALELASGAPRYSLSIGRGGQRACVAGAAVWIASDHPEVTAIDPATGATLAAIRVTGTAGTAPVRLDAGVVVGTRDGAIVALDAGGVRWRTELGGEPLTAPFVDGARVVAGNNTGRFVVLDAATGVIVAERRWPSRPRGGGTERIGTTGITSLADGTLIVSTTAGLHALDGRLEILASRPREPTGTGALRRMGEQVLLEGMTGMVGRGFYDSAEALDAKLATVRSWIGDAGAIRVEPVDGRIWTAEELGKEVRVAIDGVERARVKMSKVRTLVVVDGVAIIAGGNRLAVVG